MMVQYDVCEWSEYVDVFLQSCVRPGLVGKKCLEALIIKWEFLNTEKEYV